MNENQMHYNALPKDYLEELLSEYHNLEAMLANKYESFNVPEFEKEPAVIRIHEIWKEIEQYTYQVA
jgi:hypothetical protein